MELYCYEIEGKDVWHDGRFIDKWAGEQISNELRNCCEKRAMLGIMLLFLT